MIEAEEHNETDLENDIEFIKRFEENEYEKSGRMSGKVVRTWIR